MGLLIKEITSLVNILHDLITIIFKSFGYTFNDKQLHFIVIGCIGIIIFFISDLIFKNLSKISVSIVSFIYTLTVLIVVVFGIEIEQKITGKGNMEFADIIAGLWGFLFLFAIFLFIKGIIYLIKLIFNKDDKLGF